MNMKIKAGFVQNSYDWLNGGIANIIKRKKFKTIEISIFKVIKYNKQCKGNQHEVFVLVDSYTERQPGE